MSTPIVTVVIPVFNAEQFLRAAVESVLNQSISDWELIMVDDGSTDHSFEAAKNFASSDPRISVIHHKGRVNKGVGYSRQLGIDQSKSELIAFLDADDQFASQKIEYQTHAMSDNPDCILSHTGIRLKVEGEGWGSKQPYDRHVNRHVSRLGIYEYHKSAHFLKENPICNSTVMIRKSALNDVTLGFDQIFQAEDLALWIQLAGKGKFLAIPDALTIYRQHQDSYLAGLNSQKQKVFFSRIEMCALLLTTTRSDEIREKLITYLKESINHLILFYDSEAAATTDQLFKDLGSETEYWKQRALKSENNIINRLLNTIRGAKH